MAHDVFVSCSAKDKSVGEAVSVALEAHGLSCWIAPRDILPGSDWGGSIIEAINDARVMVLIFSANSNTSVQVKREVERAVTKDKLIIPFRIENVVPTASLEYFLGTPHWLDAFTPPLEPHLQYLAKVVRKIVGGPEISISPLVPETEPREKAEAEEARIAEEKRKAAELAELKLAEEKGTAEAAEATRLAEETRKAEEQSKLAEEKRKGAEEAQRARLADEKKKAAEAVEAEKAAAERRKVAVDNNEATDLTKKRATVISKLASAVSTQRIQHPRLFVVGVAVLLCLCGAAAWYFVAGKQLVTLKGHSRAVTDSSAEKAYAETELSSEERAYAETELKELEDKLERWTTTNRDVSSVEPFIADDFVGGKAQLLDSLRKDSDTYKFAAFENLDVHVYSQTSAVVTGVAREKGTDKDGKQFDRSYRFTDTWTKRNGQWQCTAHEVVQLF